MDTRKLQISADSRAGLTLRIYQALARRGADVQGEGPQHGGRGGREKTSQDAELRLTSASWRQTEGSTLSPLYPKHPEPETLSAKPYLYPKKPKVP